MHQNGNARYFKLAYLGGTSLRTDSNGVRAFVCSRSKADRSVTPKRQGRRFGGGCGNNFGGICGRSEGRLGVFPRFIRAVARPQKHLAMGKTEPHLTARYPASSFGARHE